ncbi:hypothetical protein ABZ746_34380 [Streptomyces sp. NPDC020096]
MGAGLTFNGNLRAIGEITTADSRSEVFSAVYVVRYAALIVPSLAAGLLAPSWGLKTTSYLYIGFVGVLSLIALTHADRSRADGPTGHAGRADSVRTAVAQRIPARGNDTTVKIR